jgi:hypothetical protein
MTTPLWLQVLGLLLTLSGWGKVVFDYVTGTPRVRGRVFNVMRGQMQNPAKMDKQLASFVTYLYLVNTRRNSVHLLDFEMEIEVEGKWTRLHRMYGVHNIQSLSFLAKGGGEVKIEKFAENLIYRKNVPVEYGKPLHGWIVFAGDAALYDANTTRYRITCIDAFRKKHRFDTKPEQFENLYLLQDMAGIHIPDGAKM